LIERDMRAAVDRPVRDGFGAPLPALQLTARRIELSRGGRGNALALPRAQIERVAYQLDGRQLQRLHWDVLDRVGGSVPHVQPLLDDVAAIEWQAIAAGGQPLAEWPGRRGQPQPLPRAIELVLRFDGPLGDVRGLLELPEAAD